MACWSCVVLVFLQRSLLSAGHSLAAFGQCVCRHLAADICVCAMHRFRIGLKNRNFNLKSDEAAPSHRVAGVVLTCLFVPLNINTVQQCVDFISFPFCIVL